jgi:Transposase DDE domain group 1
VLERAAHDPDGLARLRAARAHARARAGTAGGDPDVELLVIDADATLVLAHSDHKEGAAGTYKHTFGFHPLLAYLDRGAAPGEPLAGVLGPGNAAAGSSEDLIELVDLAWRSCPPPATSSRAGAKRQRRASTRLAWHLHDRGVGFSLGMPIDAQVREAILAHPEQAWTPPVDADAQVRDGAEVCELTGWVDLGTWPAGTRLRCRREDAHPGAQLRFPDHDGHRFQVLSPTSRRRPGPAGSCGTANAPGSRTASAPPSHRPLEPPVRHVPPQPGLAGAGPGRPGPGLLHPGAAAGRGARLAEPKTLGYRLLHTAARVVRHARRIILRLQRTWPWAAALARAFTRLRALPLRC